MSTSTISSTDLFNSLELIELKPGLKFSKQMLKNMLPDVETALFFGKVYELDARQLGVLLHTVLDTTLSQALLGEDGYHSHDLQDYVVDMLDFVPDCEMGDLTFTAEKEPQGEILPQLWEMAEVELADSIKKVAEKLHNVIEHMPGKQGEMVFRSMMVMNAKRPTLGDYRAGIHHAPQAQNLVIFDVSGSVSQATVHTIVDDVVALSYTANAHLAIVSNTCTYWEPGTYGTDDVLAAAEYSGTQYEQLSPLFDRDWGTVVTIADYDSSWGAKDAIARMPGRIDTVLDISLVSRPTFLAECVGQLADEVQPLLIAASHSLTR